jgi:cytochrome b561
MSQTTEAKTGYDSVAKTLHWLIALAVLSMLIFGWQLDDMDDTERVEMIKFHSGLGLSVLVLMVLRVLWRLQHPPPELPPMMSRWQRCAAVCTHRAFYLLLILQPVLGTLLAMSVDYSVSPFGWIEFFSWPSNIPDRTAWLRILHSTNANIIALLALGHIGAALWHHYRKKDNVLRRMLPFAKP